MLGFRLIMKYDSPWLYGMKIRELSFHPISSQCSHTVGRNLHTDNDFMPMLVYELGNKFSCETSRSAQEHLL